MLQEQVFSTDRFVEQSLPLKKLLAETFICNIPDGPTLHIFSFSNFLLSIGMVLEGHVLPLRYWTFLWHLE